MEASALPSRRARGRAPLSAAFLRLRSDEQLVAMFRAGSDDAFRAIHDRYRARLLAYARQMLRGGGSDPEDAMQDVFLRAYRALRRSDRPVILRAWLYRIAHNRCIDELRRPRPVPSELEADAEPAFASARAAVEPSAVIERTAAVTRLLADVQRLPSQQRSALLMRELQGLSYEELANALDVTVPAVKSLLLRARTGLIDLATARDTPCGEIRDELLSAADRSVRISGRARRHCSECETCETYRGELRRVRRGFASLTPSGPLAQLGMLLGLGGGGGGAAAAGGGIVAGGGTLAGATATKLAVAICCAAVIGTAGPAVLAPPSHRQAPAPAAAPVAHAAAAPAPAPAAQSARSAPSASAASPSPPPSAPNAASVGAVGQPGSTAPVDGSGGLASGVPAPDPGGASGLGGSGTTGSSGATGATGAAGATADGGGTAGSGATGSTGASGVPPPSWGSIGTGATGASGATSTPGDGPTGATGTTGTSTGDSASAPASVGATGARTDPVRSN